MPQVFVFYCSGVVNLKKSVYVKIYTKKIFLSCVRVVQKLVVTSLHSSGLKVSISKELFDLGKISGIILGLILGILKWNLPVLLDITEWTWNTQVRKNDKISGTSWLIFIKFLNIGFFNLADTIVILEMLPRLQLLRCKY